MNSIRIPWSYFLPPLFSLMIALSVVRWQTVRHSMIVSELRNAKQEVSRLAKLLPKGETVQIQDADNCKEDHASHDR